MTNHGSMPLSPKQNSNRTCGTVVRRRSTLKQIVACFFGKTGHVTTVPLEHHNLFVWSLRRNSKNEQEKTDHCAPWQCELSHISSNQCLFDRPKRRIDGYSPDLAPNDFFLFSHRKLPEKLENRRAGSLRRNRSQKYLHKTKVKYTHLNYVWMMQDSLLSENADFFWKSNF